MLALLRSGNLADPVLCCEAAWHLRQTNTQDAVDLAKTLLQADTIRSSAGPDSLLIRGYLNLVLAESYWLMGQLDVAATFSALAATSFEACTSRRGLSDALWLQSSIASDRGLYEQRTRLMSSSVDQALSAGDDERATAGRLALSFFSVLENGEAAVDIHSPYARSQLSHRSSGVRCLANGFLAHACLNRSKFVDGLEHLHDSAALALESGQIRRAIMDGTNIGYVLADLGELESCVDQAHDVLALARRAGWPPLIGGSLTVVAHALLKVGRHDAARSMAEEALSYVDHLPEARARLIALNTAADAYFACGSFIDAQRIFLDLVDHAQKFSEGTELQSYALLGLARVHLSLGSVEAARDLCIRAMSLAKTAGEVVVQVDCLRLLSKLSPPPSSGTTSSEAVTHLRDAVHLTETTVDYPASSALMQELSTALEQSGDHVASLQVLRQAVAAIAKEGARDAVRKGVALEVRFKTERAIADAEQQRQAAEAEARRAAELESLNHQLNDAMAALQSTQALLIRRNEELNAAYARISDLSLTDPLTGLRNRRFLTQVIDGAVAQCLRANRPSVFGELDPLASPDRHDIVFFLLDLDHFKLVNDQHGHTAGDAVLVQLKDRLRSVSREQDFLIRWGGEEFLVAAPGMDRRDAPLMAERLRLSVEGTPFNLADGLKLKKTVSIGFAAFPLDPGNPEAASWESVVEIADARLYAAKRSGRNRWVGEPPPADPPSSASFDRMPLGT